MKHKIILLTLVILLALLVALPAQAITFGEYDGDAHPNVGMLWARLPGDDQLYGVCTGTKVPAAAGLDYDVFLTAAHCLAWAPEGTTWLVTFDPEPVDYSADPPVIIASFITAVDAVFHPQYNHDMGDLHDLGVVLLRKDSTISIQAAAMPEAGLLDRLNAKNGLKGQSFVTVGYGSTRQDKTKGFQPLFYEDMRQFTAGTFSSLTKSWLHISMNPSTGDGGTCYGDSGGPHFLGDTDLLVSITVTGDSPCRASDVTYRIDTASAQAFLSDYISFP
jgi:hypothetical protein